MYAIRSYYVTFYAKALVISLLSGRQHIECFHVHEGDAGPREPRAGDGRLLQGGGCGSDGGRNP